MYKNGRTLKCQRELIGFSQLEISFFYPETGFLCVDYLFLMCYYIPSSQPIIMTLGDFPERSVISNIGFF